MASGNLQAYMEKLVGAFNPATVDGLMCRSTLSVGWDGRLYDCDFNQMLDLGVDAGRAADHLRRHRAGASPAAASPSAATASAAPPAPGSSCGGTIAG